MSAEGGAKPLLLAPWIIPHKAAHFWSGDRNPHTHVGWDPAYHPGCDGVALQDFAEWVSCLDPGRVIYSSHRSPTGDLYLKLQDALIIFKFACPAVTQGPLSNQNIYEMYEDAIGDPEWWRVPLISYIVMPTIVNQDIEYEIATTPCVVHSAGEWLEGAHRDAVVQEKTEIIVCNPKMLNAFLGPVKNSVLGQTQTFARDIADQEEESKLLSAIWMARYEAEEEERLMQEAARSPKDTQEATDTATSRLQTPTTGQPSPSPTPSSLGDRLSVVDKLQRRHAKGYSGQKRSFTTRGEDARVLAKRLLRPASRSVPQGSASKAAGWRAKRTGKPTAPQLGQNLDTLRALLTHIEQHLPKLMETLPDQGMSPPPPPAESPRRVRSSGTIPRMGSKMSPPPRTSFGSRGAGGSSSPVDLPEVVAEGENLKVPVLEDDGDAVSSDGEREVRIERVPSPERTEKSRSWRPPTPYARLDADAIKAMDEKEVSYEEEDEEEKSWTCPGADDKPATPPKKKPFQRHLMKRDSRMSEGMVMEFEVFDFCNFGNWKPTLKDVKTTRRRGSNGDVVPPPKH
jgi:hypothetical protein